MAGKIKAKKRKRKKGKAISTPALSINHFLLQTKVIEKSNTNMRQMPQSATALYSSNLQPTMHSSYSHSYLQKINRNIIAHTNLLNNS